MHVQVADTPHRANETRWPLLSYGFALVVALGLSYFLVHMPLQVSDDVTLIMIARSESLRDILVSEFGPGSMYLRPLLKGSVNLAFEIAQGSGRYFLTFKAVQVAQVVTLLLLFARLLRVKSARDCAAACVAVVAVVGMHTFFSTVYEVYPINTFMTIVVCCVMAFVLCDGPSSLWRDLAATALFAFALFTLETGVIVWVIVVVAFATGLRGVSLRGVIAVTAVLALYVGLKFFFLSGRLPTLNERSASVGFTSYNQQELVQNFSDRRLLFYGSNVGSSMVTIFFAEPRAGLWRFVRTIVRGQPMPFAMLLNVAVSTASSLLIFWFAWTRRHAWRRLEFNRYDSFVLVLLAAVPVNAVMSFPYTKDAIVSPAGVLYPLALYSALRAALARVEDVRPQRMATVAVCALCVLSLGWTLRAAAVPYGLLRTAWLYQQQWVHVDDWIVEQGLTYYKPDERALIERLRGEALSMDVPNIRVVGGWMKWAERMFDIP